MIRFAAFALLVITTLSFPSAALRGQWAPIPRWADSALTKTGFWSSYDYTSRTSPEVGYGDFDGDGLWDVAFGIVDKGGVSGWFVWNGQKHAWVPDSE